MFLFGVLVAIFAAIFAFMEMGAGWGFGVLAVSLVVLFAWAYVGGGRRLDQAEREAAQTADYPPQTGREGSVPASESPQVGGMTSREGEVPAEAPEDDGGLWT